jgi:large subunit ribosomal protein L5
MAFPEVSYDDVVRPQGMDVVIVTTAKTDEEAYKLLEALGCPFRRK